MYILLKYFFVVKLLKYVMKRYIFYYERVIVWIVKILFCYELKYNSNLF